LDSYLLLLLCIFTVALDQMYEELKQYRDELNKSLYVIINRHYKDFISITSKLDGVDSRVHQHMTMPLLEIIDEIKSIYTTLHSYTSQMRQKIRQKQKIQGQKRVLRGVHSGLKHYRDAERHYKNVQALTSGADIHVQDKCEAFRDEIAQRKHKNLLLYAQYKEQYGGAGCGVRVSGAPSKLATLDCLVAVCRELEQCSVSLASCAGALTGDAMEDVGSTKYAEVVVQQKNQLSIMTNQVLQMAKTKLAYCLSAHYDSVVNHIEARAAAAAAAAGSGTQAEEEAVSPAHAMSANIRDSTTHCIRVLLALQAVSDGARRPSGGVRGNITAIEQVVAEFVFDKSLK
jgi:hypothetical protein